MHPIRPNGLLLMTCQSGVSVAIPRTTAILTRASISIASYLAIDVVLDFVFGEEYNLIDKSDDRFIVKSIEDCNIRTGVLFQARKLKNRFVDKCLFSASIVSRKKLIHFVNSLLDKRMGPLPMKRNDVFSNFLVDENPDLHKGLSKAELGSEATTLLMAGKCTTIHDLY